MLFVNWLAQAAHDPVGQGASPVNIVGESVTRIVGIAWPLIAFAGLWTNWTSVRKAKEGEITTDVFGFLARK
ncbi:hypothetical protein SAMN05216338_103816 [Bradyrhizobium sp. Rc2d]|nr:hypothetical protein SAMN05216338_103816 [Bradyrhizobium sp. Rc2d]